MFSRNGKEKVEILTQNIKLQAKYSWMKATYCEMKGTQRNNIGKNVRDLAGAYCITGDMASFINQI